MTSAAIIAAAMNVGSLYDPDAAAYFARMGATQESAQFKYDINEAIVALKAAGAWSGLDTLGWFAPHDPANCLYDIRDPTATWTLGGTTVHTPDRGIAPDGSTGYIGHPLTSMAAGANYADNLALFGVYVNAQGPGSGARQPQLGGTSAARSNILAHDSGTDNGRNNQTSDSTGIHTSTTRVGHRFSVRNGNAIQWYYGATPTSAFTVTGVTPDAFQATLGRNGTAYCGDRFVFAYSGGAAWDTTTAAAFHNIMHALATARGANY